MGVAGVWPGWGRRGWAVAGVCLAGDGVCLVGSGGGRVVAGGGGRSGAAVWLAGRGCRVVAGGRGVSRVLGTAHAVRSHRLMRPEHNGSAEVISREARGSLPWVGVGVPPATPRTSGRPPVNVQRSASEPAAAAAAVAVPEATPALDAAGGKGSGPGKGAALVPVALVVAGGLSVQFGSAVAALLMPKAGRWAWSRCGWRRPR